MSSEDVVVKLSENENLKNESVNAVVKLKHGETEYKIKSKNESDNTVTLVPLEQKMGGKGKRRKSRR